MDFEVAIVGGGLVGASLAAALARAPHRIALIEREPPSAPGTHWDSRIYTLTPASIAFLERIDVWRTLPQERVTPIYDMRVFGDRASRLDFSAYESGLPQLGATAEAGQLHHALWRGLERQKNVSLICPAAPTALHRVENGAEIRLDAGRSLSAKLVVGADGASSWVRREAGMEAKSESYEQLGVVANLACARAHRNVAYQWFREGGVLALLPLPGERVSIVWSTSQPHARELLALPADAFCARVREASCDAVGELKPLNAPAAFPLNRLTSCRIALDRITLIGDAAHVVHPLAGQGINLGLGDASALSDLLERARDPGDRLLLRRFERSRAEDILAVGWTTHGLMRLFGAKHAIARRMRNMGLNLTNANPVIKNLLARRAAAVGEGLHQGEMP